MPEIDAILDGEGGKRVTITIAELGDGDPLPTADGNTFVIQSGKYILTITIAE